MYFHLTWDPADGFDDNVILKTKLPTPLYDASHYEMGIMEVSISNQFSNVPTNGTMRFIYEDELIDIEEQLPVQNYKDAGDINATLKSLIKKNKFDKLISLTKSGETITWSIQPGVEVFISNDLKSLLGLTHYEKIKTGRVEKKFQGLCDLQRNFRRIFLQSNDIIPLAHIHDTTLKVMTSFPVNYESQMTTAYFNTPVYFKLNTNQLETVQIIMLNEQIKQMRSSKGSAYCLVHIRPHHH